jgi:hypothetical protein
MEGQTNSYKVLIPLSLPGLELAQGFLLINIKEEWIGFDFINFYSSFSFIILIMKYT